MQRKVSLVGSEEDHSSSSSSESDDDETNIVGNLDSVDQVLDCPDWSNELKEAKFASSRELEDFLMKIENVLRQNLARHDYNTFGSYVEFYRSYKRTKLNLLEFVHQYRPNINSESMSCVALSLYLLRNLVEVDKQHGSFFSLVSCEEMIREVATDNESYQIESKDNVKVSSIDYSFFI